MSRIIKKTFFAYAKTKAQKYKQKPSFSKTTSKAYIIGITLLSSCKNDNSCLTDNQSLIMENLVEIQRTIFSKVQKLQQTLGINKPEDQWSCKRSPDILAYISKAQNI